VWVRSPLIPLNSASQRKAVEFLRHAKQIRVTLGKDPEGLAAAALYLAAILVGERRTQREIACVTSVTEVPVRNRYKELVRNLELSL
jgi:transcription initiation factor TFIIB